MNIKKVILKQEKERSILVNRHPWIFSGAIDQMSSDLANGDLAHVYSAKGEFLALAYFHTENSLSGRILSFEPKPVKEVLQERILQSWNLRKTLIDFSHTNCFRLINAEEDGLPGWIVDFYDGVLVMQVNTYGMEKLKPLLVEWLVSIVHPKTIYEKSTSSARLQEGLDFSEGLIWGEAVSEVVVRENGIQFFVSIIGGQKTGFFLDQREMRKKIRELSNGRSVLNCFAYSGGFSLNALQGGAEKVTSVDICSKACQLNEKNTLMNGFSLDRHAVLEEDVFHFLKNASLSDYQLIILDPPAFAKKRQDLTSATKGYKQLNRLVLEQCSPNTLLLTCSCSYFIDEDLFQQILFQAASASKRNVKILLKHLQALDHPVSLYHPEGEYLKSFLLLVE